MEQPFYPEVTPSSPNPPLYSKKEPCNQQTPLAFGPPIPIVPTQYQPYYIPYNAVPSQGPVVQPLLQTTFIVPVQSVHVLTYLGYSVFTMLCCLPLGIAASVFSIRTQDANHEGNITEARWNFRMAQKFAHSALGIGIALGYLIFVLRVVVF